MQYYKIFCKSKFKDIGQQYSKIGIIKIRNAKCQIRNGNTVLAFSCRHSHLSKYEKHSHLRRQAFNNGRIYFDEFLSLPHRGYSLGVIVNNKLHFGSSILYRQDLKTQKVLL
jgi:hypothetical protein